MSGGLSSERELTVEWGDCDPSGLAFYPRYYEWMDASTHVLLGSVGLDHHALRRDHGVLGTPLVQATARYVSYAVFGDVLRARARIARLGSSSIIVEHSFHAGERLLVEGEEVRVWARDDRESRQHARIRAVPIPDAVRALLWRSAPPLPEAGAAAAAAAGGPHRRLRGIEP
jgi:4-hydroxybenzoyl-CoA thioesterase